MAPRLLEVPTNSSVPPRPPDESLDFHTIRCFGADFQSGLTATASYKSLNVSTRQKAVCQLSTARWHQDTGSSPGRCVGWRVRCLLDTSPDILDISSTRSRSWSDAVSVDTQPDLDKFDTRADTDKFDNDYVKCSQCSHQTLSSHVRHGTVWANQTISYDTKHGRTRKRQITPQALPLFTPRVPH